jgi:hypothetical protein
VTGGIVGLATWLRPGVVVAGLGQNDRPVSLRELTANLVAGVHYGDALTRQWDLLFGKRIEIRNLRQRRQAVRTTGSEG